MKLRNPEDKAAFLVNINRVDLINEEISDENLGELMELFIKRRRPLVRKLVNFRRRQIQKGQWRKQRWKYLRGIRKWHRSVKAKRFHRAMGRYLATRIFRPKMTTLANRYESLDPLQDEALKAISSIRTHMYIDLGYYQSIEEEADLFCLLEYAIPILNEVEIKLFQNSDTELTEDEMELLLRLVDENELCKSFSDVLRVDPEQVVENYRAIIGKMSRTSSRDNTLFYSSFMEEFVDTLLPLVLEEEECEMV